MLDNFNLRVHTRPMGAVFSILFNPIAVYRAVRVSSPAARCLMRDGRFATVTHEATLVGRGWWLAQMAVKNT